MYLILLLTFVALVTFYVAYQRIWHPLAVYPGPYWASLSDLWNAKTFWSGQHPYRLTELHEKYGPVVRFGPNRLSFTSQDAINTIFVKGFKTMPKTEFYDTFGSKQYPNLFNATDMAHHSQRRRALLKLFRPQNVAKWDEKVDKHINAFRDKVRKFSSTGEAFNLKKSIYLLCCDIVGDLMYGRDLGALESGEPQRMPDDHRWARWTLCLGAMPTPFRWFLPVMFFVPHPQASYKRNTLSYTLEAQRIIQQRRKDIEAGLDLSNGDVVTSAFLTHMNEGKEESAPAPLTNWDLAHELTGFIFAGIHPPAASLAVLFWNMLHNPKCLEQARSEISRNLPALTPERGPYSLADVDNSLPWLRACVKESFRITPVFTMPLTRRIVDNETFLNGRNIPKGTDVAVCNHAFHHNPDVFGPDHNVFDPARWEDKSNSEASKLLLQFGAGGRQCIGKPLALSIIHKLTATLLAEFILELADPQEQQAAVAGEFRGRLPPMLSTGISDVKGAIMVRAVDRQAGDA